GVWGRLAMNCCKVTEAGKVLWNEGIIIELVEKLGVRSVKFGKEFKYIKYYCHTMTETNYEEIKEWILMLMNKPYSQRERLHLIRKNVFFSEKLLKNLKEAIPDRATEDCFEFDLDVGYLIVTKDETYI